MQGQVMKDGMRYYSIDSNSDDRSIMIVLSALSDGDPDMVVSFGEDSRPTLDTFDWSSSNFMGDQLIIEKGQNEKVRDSVR